MVVGSADEFKGIELVIVKDGKLIKPKQIIWKKDGAKMRRIPAGPPTPVFYMDRTEVTAGQFKKFVQDSRYNYEGNWWNVDKHSPTANHPMIYVSWNEVMVYTKWVDKKLPTIGQSCQAYKWVRAKAKSTDPINFL